MRKVDPKVEEAVETLNMKDGPTRRKLLSGTGLISATAAASALLAACSSSSSTATAAKSAAGNFPKHPRVEVRLHQPRHHQPVLRAHPVRVRGRRGAARHSQAVLDRVGQLQRAADGQRHERRDLGEGERHRGRGDQRHRVHHPGRQRHERRHSGQSPTTPTATPPATRGHQPARLHRPGPVRLRPGSWGRGSRRPCPAAGDAVGFIATPGTANIQPRIDGAKAALKAPARTSTSPRSPPVPSCRRRTPRSTPTCWHTSPRSRGSSRWTRARRRPCPADRRQIQPPGQGGLRRVRPHPADAVAIKAGSLGFTIDQQPYLQGFLPALYLYLCNLSGGLVEPAGDQHRPVLRHQGQCGSLPVHHVPLRGLQHGEEASSRTPERSRPESTTERIRAWITALAAGDWSRENGPSPRQPARGSPRERQETIDVSETAERAR